MVLDMFGMHCRNLLEGLFFPGKLPATWHMEVSINGGIQNGWFIRENPTKIDDLGVPLFQETPIW